MIKGVNVNVYRRAVAEAGNFLMNSNGNPENDFFEARENIYVI